MSSPATHARKRRRKTRPSWSWLLPGAMLLAAAAIPMLVWYAADAILNSTDGNVTQTVADPTAPGYEVLVVPSPSHMVLSLGPTGQLTSATIISLASNDRGGTALFIPGETIMASEAPGGRLVDIFAAEGEESTRFAVASLIDVNVDDLTILDAAGWAQVLTPVGPIPVDLNADLVATNDDGSVTVAFAQGNTEVVPDRAAEFMAWLNPNEPRAGRIERQLEFWKTWVAAIAASADPAAIPGEADSGIGRMLRGLANGPAVIQSVTGPEVIAADGTTGVQIDQVEVRGLIGEMIPFPRPVTDGARPRVRLLDGVGGLDVASAHAQQLVASGAQIVIVGNAASFDVDQTVVIYHDQRFEAQAVAFSQDLGDAEISFEPLADAVLDVTVIIGSDEGLALGE